MKTIAIIGGGVSGLVAAANLSMNGIDGACIHIFESADKIGRPILRSGNGRCNFSNLDIDFSEYRNGYFVKYVQGHLKGLNGSNPACAFFESIGIYARSESEGRLYPYPNKASVVLDALRHIIEENGCNIYLQTKVGSIDHFDEPGRRIGLRLQDGSIFHTDILLLACGGKESQGNILEGFTVEDFEPTLGPVKITDAKLRMLDNIRVKSCASLVRGKDRIASERGEVLFRKYGLSGIAVFNLSRKAEVGDSISLDLVPDLGFDETVSLLADRFTTMSKAYGKYLTMLGLLRGLVLVPVADLALKRAHLDPDTEIGDSVDSFTKIAASIKDLRFEYGGIADADLCQVYRGGISPDDIDSSTMGSRLIRNVYLAGEAIDVDGPCGGYNIHWAIVSALVASNAIARDWKADQ